MRDVAEWLERLGLAQHAALFADNAVDLRVLPHLTEEDLRELGLPLGHRRILLAAIAGLGDKEAPRKTPTSVTAMLPSASSIISITPPSPARPLPGASRA